MAFLYWLIGLWILDALIIMSSLAFFCYYHVAGTLPNFIRNDLDAIIERDPNSKLVMLRDFVRSPSFSVLHFPLALAAVMAPPVIGLNMWHASQMFLATTFCSNDDFKCNGPHDRPALFMWSTLVSGGVVALVGLYTLVWTIKACQSLRKSLPASSSVETTSEKTKIVEKVQQ